MEELEFQQILETKRHDELLAVLSSISEKMDPRKKDEVILLLMQEIKKLVNKIETFAKSDNKEGIDEIKKLSTAWVKVADKLKPSSQWTFDIKRNDKGFIESVDATKIQ